MVIDKNPKNGQQIRTLLIPILIAFCLNWAGIAAYLSKNLSDNLSEKPAKNGQFQNVHLFVSNRETRFSNFLLFTGHGLLLKVNFSENQFFELLLFLETF